MLKDRQPKAAETQAGDFAVPFRGDKYQGTYSPQDLAMLNEGLQICCGRFAPDEMTEALRNRLAKNIIAAFDQGASDPQAIADLAAKMGRNPNNA